MTRADKKGEIVESRFRVQLESVQDGSGFRLLKDKITGLMNRRIQDYDPSSYGKWRKYIWKKISKNLHTL